MAPARRRSQSAGERRSSRERRRRTVRGCLAPALGGSLREPAVDPGRIEQGADLRLLLEDRLQQRQLQPGSLVEGERAGGDLLGGAAQHEGIEHLVGDQAGGGVELLRTPGGRDPVAQLALEAGAGQAHVAEHAHHVDHERLALGAVEGLATAPIHQREQVAGRLDRVGVASCALGRDAQAADDARQRGDRLRGTRKVAVRLLAGQLDELLPIGGDHQRDAVRRREHRLDRRQALDRRREPLARPERPDLVHGSAHALDRRVGRIRDPHLLEAQREPGPEAHHDPAGGHLVQGRAGHRQHHRVPGVRVHRAERDAEAVVALIGPQLGGDGAHVADRVAFEVGVVDPDRVEPGGTCGRAPGDDLADLAASGQAEPDPACNGIHLASSAVPRRGIGGSSKIGYLILAD